MLQSDKFSPPETMKISEKIAAAEKEGRPWWSFEFFPPKTGDGWVNLFDRIERMLQLGPSFIDITWGAGGTTSGKTTDMVRTAHEDLGLETCMHLTCTNMPVATIDVALEQAYNSGCRNILALRGDPPAGTEEWEKIDGGFEHAIDLIRHIRKKYGDYFDVAIAGFPQGHPDSDDPEMELEYLKQKVDAGANVIITQMFYDADVFIAWARRVRAAGINIAIAPGVMPIQTYAAFKRRTAFARTIVPQELEDLLEPIKDDDAKVRDVGTRYVADMCRKILAADIGVSGCHIYTMNLSRGTELLLAELGFVAYNDIVKPMPWRPSLTNKRRSESTRPIFWSNRQRSYRARTSDWDEFPNGRWGSQASPAFGDATELALALPRRFEAADGLWGVPLTLADIAALFARFVRGELSYLPWSDLPPAKETSVISGPLAAINSAGFLTINSQPAVDGLSSTDPVFGWGPPNGYIYQKAYLEFFCSPDELDALLRNIAETCPSASYHAVNKTGDLLTNSAPSPNAVTWGVFPAQEIIQPTIVDGMAFLAWKDEAFELWASWANLYKVKSPPTVALMHKIMNSYYLVNVVYNDFKNTTSEQIFEAFTKTATANLRAE